LKDIFKINNFDLIRLMASLQVAFHHTLELLNVEHQWFLTDISALFPGVPVFFFVSGFLISKSYENNSVIIEYSRNRILRIYPALIVCTFMALLSVLLTGYFTNINTRLFQVVIWIAGQISFVQFYHPDFMRGFGTGVLNGSLWTITVELQFYILVPILYWLFFGVAKSNSSRQNITLVIFVFLFGAIHIIHYHLLGQYSDKFLFKLWGVSFCPWFYMFLVGVLFQKNFERIYRVLQSRFFFILLIYISSAYFTTRYFGWRIGNEINPLLYLLLATVIFSFAYSFPTLGNYILRKNDLSYGVYIYHIPILNLFIYCGYISNIWFVLLLLVLAIIAASISWLLIEKPAIRLKKDPLNPLRTTRHGKRLQYRLRPSHPPSEPDQKKIAAVQVTGTLCL
jgi:peptidoglycan/LPS O-acetylase OafA/YrhL